MRRNHFIIFLVVLVLAGAGAWVWQDRFAPADTGPVYTGLVEGTAVGGYDPVSYFSGTPVEGSENFTLQYRGATWRFSSAENLATFETDPEHYAPAYGGYCAWAMAQGSLAKGDPQYWEIVGDRLYLNYDAGVQRKWQGDKPGFIEKANAKWVAQVAGQS